MADRPNNLRSIRKEAEAGTLASGGKAFMPHIPLGNEWIMPEVTAVGGVQTAVIEDGAIHLVDLWLPTGTFDRFAVPITVAGPGAQLRCGIYRADPATGVPTSLVTGSSGTVAAAVGSPVIPINAQTANGPHWLAVVSQGAQCTGWRGDHRTDLNTFNTRSTNGGLTGTGLVRPHNIEFKVVGTFNGELPASLTGLQLDIGTQCPHAGVRRAGAF